MPGGDAGWDGLSVVIGPTRKIFPKSASPLLRSALAGKRPPLLPVAHTTQKVNVEVSLAADGAFLSARVLHPTEMTTVIPCTEESSARTSDPVPHPLVDKLQYVAGDYADWGGGRKSMWAQYLDQLQTWCASPFGLPAVRAVLAYLEKGCLIRDLVACKVLFADETGHLRKKWHGPKDDTPPIFQSIPGGDQTEAFIRFRVDGNALSSDPAVWDSYTRYYLSTLHKAGICYIQGEEMPVSRLSPYKIRNAGDRAKLISSNDGTNFTYRGRFTCAEEAFSIGYETTQKAHSALRWLVGRQGVQNGSQTILAWGTENEPLPQITGDACDVVKCSYNDLEDELDASDDASADPPQTREAFATAFDKAIQGYRHKLPANSQVSVMVLDSATPGRLSVRYYRELQGSRLIDNVADWHEAFGWEMRYRKLQPQESGKKKPIPLVFVGAPAPADIAKAAYGEKVDEKLKKQTIERLLPCITEGRKSFRKILCWRRLAGRRTVLPWNLGRPQKAGALPAP